MSQGNWKRYMTINDLTRAARGWSKASRQAASVARPVSELTALDERSVAALQRWYEVAATMVSAEPRLFELEMDYAIRGELPIYKAERLAAARADFVGQPRWTVKRKDSSGGGRLVDLSWVIRQGRQGELGNGIVAIRCDDDCGLERMIVIERGGDILQMTDVLRTPDGEEHGEVLSEDLQPQEYAELLRELREDAEQSPEYIDLTVKCETVEEMLPCLRLAEAVDRGEPGPEIPVLDRTVLTSRLFGIDPILGQRAEEGSPSTVYGLALDNGLIGPEGHFAVRAWCADRGTWNCCGD